MEKAIRILGIDPGLNYTGYGIISFVPGHFELITSGTIIVPKGELASRLAFIYQQLATVIETHLPEVSTIEKTFLNTNAQSSLLLSHARGVAMCAAATHNLECKEFSTREIKKSVTGYGAAGKEQVSQMVTYHLKADKKLQEDEADALAAAICYANSCILFNLIPGMKNSFGVSGTASARKGGSSRRARSEWTKVIEGKLK